jgi:hypothetical protein
MLVFVGWNKDFMMFVFLLALAKLLKMELQLLAKKHHMNYPNQQWENGVNMAIVRLIEHPPLNWKVCLVRLLQEISRSLRVFPMSKGMLSLWMCN